MSRSLFVGVDGGGTKTHCVVIPRVDGDKNTKANSSPEAEACYTLVASVKTGASNHNSVGIERARANIVAAIRDAVAQAGEGFTIERNVRAVTMGLAGVDRRADKAMVRDWMKNVLPAHVRLQVHNDAVPALASGTLGKLEDKSSGYWIGCRVLSSVWASYDGTGPKSSLENALMHHLKLDSIKELIPWTYSDLSWSRVAALAPLAFQESETGDDVACSIIDEAAASLFKHISTVASKLGFAKDREFVVVFAGGIWQGGNKAIGKKVIAQCREKLPGARCVYPRVEPAVGAALLALYSS